MITDEELELINESHALAKAFVASKATRESDPETYNAAKKAMSEHRAYWRRVREALALTEGVDDGVVFVDPIEATTGVQGDDS